jgi:hypothetical protein
MAVDYFKVFLDSFIHRGGSVLVCYGFWQNCPYFQTLRLIILKDGMGIKAKWYMVKGKTL